MLVHLSADIIWSDKRTVSFDRGTDDIVSKDKYPSIFSPQMKAIVRLIGLKIFFTTRVLKIGEYSRIFPSFSWGTFGHVTYLGQSRASENIWWIVVKNMYKTTNEIRNHRLGGRAIAQPLELQMTWIIYEFCSWKVTKWRSSDPLWNNYIPRDNWFFSVST